MTTIVSYHTRISFQDIKYVNYLGGHTPKSFLVYEDADEEVKRDHLHCVHYLDKKELQFKKLLKLKFTELGAGNWACRLNEDTSANLIYACKGKSKTELPNVQFNNWLTPDEIVECHRLYWEKNEKLKTESKTKKKKDETFSQMVNRTYPHGTVPIIGIGVWDQTKREEESRIRSLVLKHVVNCLGGKGSGFDYFIVNKLVNACMLYNYRADFYKYLEIEYFHKFDNTSGF